MNEYTPDSEIAIAFREPLADFVGQDGFRAFGMAQASKEAGWNLTSAKPQPDGTWEIQLTGPDGKTVIPHRLNDKEAAMWIGTYDLQP